MAASERGSGLDARRLRLREPPRGFVCRRSLVGGLAFSVGEPPASGFELGRASRLHSTERGEGLTLGLLRGANGAEFLERFGEGPVRLGHGGGQGKVARGHRGGELAALRLQVRLGRRELLLQAGAIALGRGHVAGGAGVAQLQFREGRPRRFVGSAPFGFDFRAGGQAAGKGGRLFLGLAQGRQGHVGQAPTGGESLFGLRPASRGLEPAGSGAGDDRPAVFDARGLAGGLLLGLGGQPARLRPQLGEHVFDPGEVGIRFEELLLGLLLVALVAPDTGHFLEQRPPLLGPERQRLVHHALADEQERVVGEVGRVQQIDEILEPDPLLVEQVVVLAGSKEPPAELDRLEVDRQQPVLVAENQRHVGHAEGGALLRAGEDDVLGLAQSKRAALLAERPSQSVREIALAGAVGSDDGADAGTELDERSLPERFEALQAKCQESCRGGHGVPRAARRRRPPAAGLFSAGRSSASAGSAGSGSAGSAETVGRMSRSSSIQGSSAPEATLSGNSCAKRCMPALLADGVLTSGSSGSNSASSGARFGQIAGLLAKRLDGFGRGGCLGDPPRMAFTDADHSPADCHFHPEHLVVVRAHRVDQVVLRPLAGEALGELLETALGTLEGSERTIARQLRSGQSGHEGAGRLVPEIQVQSADQRFEGRGQEAGPSTSATLGFAFAEQQVLTQLEAIGQSSQSGRAHDRSPPSGQNALVVVRMATIEGVRNGQAYDGVAQEFEALVVAGGQVPMLVQIAAVDQRLLQQIEITDREPQPLGESGCGAHQSSRRLGRVLVDVVGGVLDRADLLGVFVGDLGAELFLEAHDQLDEVQQIGVQVVDERGLRLDLFFIDTELLDDDLLESLVGSGH